MAGDLGTDRMFVRQYVTPVNSVTTQVGSDIAGNESFRGAAADANGLIYLAYRRGTTANWRTVSPTGVIGPQRVAQTADDVTDIFLDVDRNIYLVGRSLIDKFSPTGGQLWSVSGPQLGFIPLAGALHFPSGDLMVLLENESAVPNRMSGFFVKQAPTAANDSFVTPKNVLFSGAVTANDRYWDGATCTLVSQPSNGIVTLQSNGNFSYQSSGSFSGQTSFIRIAGPSLACQTQQIGRLR